MFTSPSASPRLQSRFRDLLQVTAPSDERSLVYRHNPSLPKPGFHPLVTPRGHVLTGWEMSDHVWHRGLWFTIKFVDKDNFWEEQAPFGVQTTVSEPRMETVDADTARIIHELRWDSPSGDPVLSESRSLTMRLSADGVTTLDWETTLHMNRAVTLDRTPFTTWGGYGGLALRASREMHDVSFLLPDGRAVPAINGESHPWVVLQGRMDGGADERVSVCFIDHPENPGAPSPWYAKANPGFTFINAAFLFHGPLVMTAGDNLRFRYRMLYRDGLWSPEAAATLADAFRRSTTTTTS